MTEIEIIPPKRDGGKRSTSQPKPQLLTLIYAIAVIIVIFWLIGVVLHFAAWLIGALLPLAALVIIAGLIYRYIGKK